MYICFYSLNGSNPYIATNNKALFRMICNYITTQAEPHIFQINEKRKWNGKPNYSGKKEVLRAFVQEWQEHIGSLNYSLAELVMWGAFFEEYGRKYGLCREFKENGVM